MYNSNDTPYAQPLDAPANGRGVASRPLVRHPGWRAKLHDLLNRPSSSPSARLLHVAVLGVILLSTLFFVLESLPTVAEWGGWGPIDGLVAILFTVEYVARLVVAPDGRGDEEADDAPAPAAGAAGCWAGARCRFARQPMAITKNIKNLMMLHSNNDASPLKKIWLKRLRKIYGYCGHKVAVYFPRSTRGYLQHCVHRRYQTSPGNA